jgi:hypothetical protein
MVADSALCPVSLVVQAGHRCAVEQTYLLGLGRIGSAGDAVLLGSHSVQQIPALAESKYTAAHSSMPLLSRTARRL